MGPAKGFGGQFLSSHAQKANDFAAIGI